MFECEMCLECYGLQKEDDIPGALITDSTQRDQKNSFFVAPPGRGEESGHVKSA